MSVRSTTRLWEARVADLKEVHEREVKALRLTIDALAEQIEYLRMTAAGPHVTTRVQGSNPSDQPELIAGERSYLTEEEEDLHALKEFGHISELELEQALAQAGLRNTQVQIET